MSDALDDQRSPDKVHENRLAQALADIGEFSSHVSAIEVWVINEKRTRLVRPEGAWWRDPLYEPPKGFCNVDEEKSKEALKRLEDDKHIHYIEPQSLQPGVGLAGQLWAEKTTKIRPQNGESISVFRSFHGLGVSSHSRHASLSYRNSFRGIGNLSDDKALIWRGLQFIACDPDQIHDNRMNAFLEAGLGLVAGCPFDLPYSKGIALFFAKSDINRKILEDERNDDYLKRSVPLIGSILALSDSIVKSWENKQEEIASIQKKRKGSSKNLQIDEESSLTEFPQNEKSEIKVEAALLELTRKELLDSNSPSETYRRKSVRALLLERIVMMKNKTFDSQSLTSAPPPMSNAECVWTFSGSFLTLIAISHFSQYVHLWAGNIPLGPMGALATLLFGLTSAPASQPKSALYGSIIAGSTALIVSYIPSYYWFNLKLSLSVSVSIAMMARLGVTHPPAGALAVALTMDDNLHWGSLIQYLISVIIAIAIANVLNNLNEKRKYPQYWGLLPAPFLNVKN